MPTIAARVSAIMSMPRLGFTANFKCAAEVFGNMGVLMSTFTGAFWEQGMSKLLMTACEKNDYVITLDYDTVFTRQHVLDMLRIAHDYAADAVFPVQLCRESQRLAVEPHTDELRHGMPDMTQEVMRARSGHFGCSVIRCASLKKLPQPWFMSFPNEEGLWEDGPGRHDADVAFWIVANHFGWKCLQANHVRIGHCQQMITWPTKDLALTHQYYTDWEKNGPPTEALGPTVLNQGLGDAPSASSVPVPQPEGFACAW